MFDLRGKSSLAVSVALLLALSAGSDATPRRHSRSRGHSTRTRKLRHDLAQIRGRKGAARAELRATRKKAHVVKLDIMSVDNKLIQVKDQLDTTKERLGQAKHEQVTTGQRLQEATADLVRTRELVRFRIKRIYMQGRQSSLSALSGTRSGGDVASRTFLMAAIERKDRSVFNHYAALQDEVAKEKRRKDEIVVEVAHLESSQKQQTQELADTRQEKAGILDTLRHRQADLEQMIRQFEEDENRMTSEIQAFERAQARMGRTSPTYLGSFSGRFIRPVSGRITSTFGSRYHPILHRVRMHTGVDFGASMGTPIHAAAGGFVIFASVMRGYGNVVIVAHGGGFSTVYAHTSRMFCSTGQRVARGQIIAAVGATGLATAPHLHFEVRINGRPVNPLGHL